MHAAVLRNGVKRDALLWLGDFRVEYLCNVAAFGDADLARKCLFMIAASQREDGAIPAAAAHGGGHQHPANVEYMPSIPFSSVANWVLLNYDADFISTVKEYIWHSGDRAILEDLWPCLKRLVTFLSSFELDRARAFDEYITDGFTSWAAMHLNIYWGMGDMLELAAWQKDETAARTVREYRARLAEKIRAMFRDSASGVFMEPAAGAEKAKTSWVLNSYAILAGMVEDRGAARGVLSRVTADPAVVRPCGGWGRFWTLMAMFESGLEKDAVGYIRRDWGRLLDAGLTTCVEGFDDSFDIAFPNDEYKIIGSLCHGWTAGPCYLLPAYVLGVRPTAIGYERVEIRPFLGDLLWAEGTIPTPRGDVFVRWENGARLSGQVLVPEGIEATIRLPDGRPDITLGSGWHSV